MQWIVKFHSAFEAEFEELSVEVKDQLLAHALVLEKFGPQLGRPWVDTLKNSRYPNMKELRFRTKNGVWRVAFAYDPKRQAILLVAGNKSGISEMRFYRELIQKADARFSSYLADLEELIV